MNKRKYILLIGTIFLAICYYGFLFYPRKVMPIGETVEVTTLSPEKYHNDCLHPCIRYDEKSGKYFMAQSPYYGWNNQVENPMFYSSHNYMHWYNGQLIADTPQKGYNSDPNILLNDNGEVLYIWRECNTDYCDSICCVETTVGGLLPNRGGQMCKRVFAVNFSNEQDVEQCPILMKHNGEYYIYAAWYQYVPVRKNLGIAIWRGTALENPDFELQDTIPFESTYTVDRALNIPLLGHIFYVPKPLYHDLWHFDLFEYEDKLYMVSVAEKGDNIMLSVSNDWRHFKTYRKPLVNNHYTENYCGYRQYYYKPTAFVKDDTLHVFYTANAKDDPNRNQLFHTAIFAQDVLR